MRKASSLPVIFGSRRSRAIKGGVQGWGSMMLLHTAQRVLTCAGRSGGRGSIRTVQWLSLGGAALLPITSCTTCILRVAGACGVRVLIRHARPACGEECYRGTKRENIVLVIKYQLFTKSQHYTFHWKCRTCPEIRSLQTRCHGTEMAWGECLDGTPCRKPSCSTPAVGFEPSVPSSLHESDLQGVSALANIDATTRDMLHNSNRIMWPYS